MSAFVTGGAGTGKTFELLRRVGERAAGTHVLVTAASPASFNALAKRLPAHPNVELRELHAIAFDVLPHAEQIDDVRAAALFRESAQPLLTMDWAEFVEAQVDPEVPGLRAPERFLDAAFRLLCKLRDARISPERFLESALRGATTFYANPPNLAHPDLLSYTKDAHRPSLDADAGELQRQYRREVDLAKILSKLYRLYLDHPVRRGCLTPRDAIAEAATALEADPQRAARLRERWPALFVDDAEELTLGELQLLQAIYGETLEGVTLAGDPESSTSAFRGARPDRVFAIAGERVEMAEQRRSPPVLDAACRHLFGARTAEPFRRDETQLTLFRATTRRAEAQFIAEHTIRTLEAGASHDDIAIVFRSVANVRPYRDALLERNVRVQVAGDLNLFTEPEAVDALALLWTLHDPFRHEYLLRVLAGAAFGFSDATLYALCSEPPDAQTLLFAEESDEQLARSGRWDPKRDVRLGWNVLHGDQDASVSVLARERLEAFRAMREHWLEAMKSCPLPELARMVWSQGLARAGSPGSAVADYQQLTLSRLYDRILRFASSNPQASLAEFLDYAQERASGVFEECETTERRGAVRLLSVDAARGREFDHVVIPSARAGSFPRWYAPDAFLYSPSLGMIPKENVGDARAPRTAKFSYYMFKTKTREAYNREERRAFVYALRRARKSALVTAYERPTRGVAAPEFLHELQAASLPGTVDLSDRWRPAQSVYAAR